MKIIQYIKDFWPVFLGVGSVGCILIGTTYIGYNQHEVIRWMTYSLLFGVPFMAITSYYSYVDMKARHARIWREMEERHARELEEMHAWEVEVRKYLKAIKEKPKDE